MSLFDYYTKYYDIMYSDKDYIKESIYISDIIEKYSPTGKRILNLGCGTGKHDRILNKAGFHVTGVDQSEAMLNKAKSSSDGLDVEYYHGDIRNFRLAQTFDAVLSLFHVISYQISNQDVGAAFETARIHLAPGAIFAFDIWYGPAVLTDRPTVRVKRAENDDISVTRIAEPQMKPGVNVVDVSYSIIGRSKRNTEVDEFSEIHSMRYFFQPELELLLKLARFEVVKCEEWMTGAVPGFSSWSVLVVARAV